MTISASFPDTPPESNPVNCMKPGEIHFMLTFSQTCFGIRVIGLPISMIALYGSVQTSEVFSWREAINLIKRVEMPTERSPESSLVSNSKSILIDTYSRRPLVVTILSISSLRPEIFSSRKGSDWLASWLRRILIPP